MTRAAIAHEADLIQALVRMQAASMAAALAEQSEQTRSLLFDMIQGYQSENGFATGSTDYEADDSARDASGFLDAVRQRLQEPLTSAEIIGACKVICAQLPRPEKVRELLEAHRRDLLEPSAVLLKIFELMPEGSDCLNSGVQRKLESQFRRGCCDNGTERLTA